MMLSTDGDVQFTVSLPSKDTIFDSAYLQMDEDTTIDVTGAQATFLYDGVTYTFPYSDDGTFFTVKQGVLRIVTTMTLAGYSLYPTIGYITRRPLLGRSRFCGRLGAHSTILISDTLPAFEHFSAFNATNEFITPTSFVPHYGVLS